MPSILPAAIPQGGLLAFCRCQSEYQSQMSRFRGDTIAASSPNMHQLQFSSYGNEQKSSGSGVYIDLGSISADEIEDNKIGQVEFLHELETPNTATIEEWRSKHWIVLIDDESSIRLAIGDYLHSMGYSCITACDGPMAFLDVLLTSCSWSLLNQDDEGDKDTPPWIDSEKNQLWRLPNCVISDIRMPGGIDGVQLLEILRRSPAAADENVKNNAAKQPKKKKRGRPKKDESGSSVYDGKDDFELLDAIVTGDSAERITKPADQAMQYVDAIRGCIDFFSQEERGKRQQYPSSLNDVPVILLTAKAMVSDRIVGYRAGANGYLPKPFRPEELLGMVDSLMRKQERKIDKLISAQNYGTTSTEEDIDASIQELTPEEAKEITKELAEIKTLLRARVDQQEMERDKVERDKLQLLLPEALRMLRTGERRKMFTKDHIRSILAFCFGVHLSKRMSRDDLLAELEKQSAEYPEKLMTEN